MRSIISRRVLGGALGLLALAASAGAQSSRAEQRERDRQRDRDDRRSFSFSGWDDSDRPRLGISTGSGGMRDTLGLLVTSVTQGGPAEKAGVQEGDRIQAVDGINLRLSKEDAEEGDMDGVALRRLTREVGKKKVGDEVELKLWSDGKAKTVRVKTMSAQEVSDLFRDRYRTREDRDERAVLGVSLGSTGSRRDTLGLMVMRVTPDGPAEKAGINEGDRIAAINGVDLRTPKEDAEDGWFGGVRQSRLSRELRKLEVGKDAELRIVSGRETRTVRVKPVKASDLEKSDRRHGGYFMFGDGFDGDVMIPPMPPVAPRVRIGPIGPIGPRVFQFDGGIRGMHDLDAMGLDGGMRIRVSPELKWEVEDRVRDAMERVRESLDRGLERSFDRSNEIGDRVREQIERSVRPAIRRARVRATV